MSLNEYSRWVPEPVAERTVGDDELGAGPVVELAVGDAGRGARGRAAVADLLVRGRHRVGEQRPLLGRATRLHHLLSLRIRPIELHRCDPRGNPRRY